MRASTTGMLYVLDEPSVGLHPSNVEGLRTTIAALARNGNRWMIVEHELELIRTADWIIELGPGAGTQGGRIVAQGTPAQLEADAGSIIGPFLAGTAAVRRDRAGPGRPRPGEITLTVGDLYNLHDVTAAFPAHRLTALAGPSGAGKTALVLDSLVPAARAQLTGSALPGHVRALGLAGIRQVVQIDAAPIGQNARSTPATYSGAFDQIRSLFADRPTPGGAGGSPGTSRSTPARASAPRAAGSATSISTCSTCPTSPSSAPPATAPASTTRRWASASMASPSPTCSG